MPTLQANYWIIDQDNNTVLAAFWLQSDACMCVRCYREETDVSAMVVDKDGQAIQE